MSVFRLETFTPGSGPPRAPADGHRDLEALREAAWRAGYVAGQAAATESFLADQALLTSELIEALSDARLTNEAARRHVAAGIAPMIEALCAAIAPALAHAGLGAELARVVERAIEAAPEARPKLRCAAEVAPGLRTLMAERHLAVDIEEAPELLPREAQVFWDQGYDHIDLDACVAQVRACVASHLQPDTKGDDDDPGRDG
jgi:hypothetical protein